MEFTNNWFDISAKINFESLIPQLKPKRCLEIGSYEGRSACYLIEKLGNIHDLEIHCIDTWEGGAEHKKLGIDMDAVKNRFIKNTEESKRRVSKDVSISWSSDQSDRALIHWLRSDIRWGYYDLIYIDGSHKAKDVLSDAVLAFKLLRPGGLMAFDDYCWRETMDPLNSPKIAIDAFLNIYWPEIRIVPSLVSQIWIEKL